MKTELLILIADDESFCINKQAFVDFLKIDSLISITGDKINFRKTVKARDQVSAKFRIETNKVKSSNERYFLLVMECDQQAKIDEFSELSERLKDIVQRISPGATTVNTMWDGVGRIYAEKSYPVINEVENLMRRLIAKFMLITVGVNWSKDAINPELYKKIENFDEVDPYLNDLHKLDFIHLIQVLFDKKRDIPLEELDRLLLTTKFTENDKERILKYIPRSNWEKYFASLVDEKDHNIEDKWKLLYKLRNKVAHNRNVKKSEYEQIKGLAGNITEIIKKATSKLGEIDLNEEDRELIKYSYRSDSMIAIGYLSEKAVAEHYMQSGYEITTTRDAGPFRSFDFIASKDGKNIAVEVKALRRKSAVYMMRTIVMQMADAWKKHPDHESISNIHVVFALRDDDSEYPLERIIKTIDRLSPLLEEEKIEIRIGYLDDSNSYNPF